METTSKLNNAEMAVEKEEEEEELEENEGPMSLKVALKKRGTTIEKFVNQARLETLMKDYKPSKLKQMKSGDPIWSDTISTLAPTDVVYPSVQGSRSMYGNSLMSRIVRLNLAYFNTLTKKEKRTAIDAIVGHFEKIGSRFLEAPPRNSKTDGEAFQSYRFFSLQGVITKVLYLFRIQTFRHRRKLRLATAGDGNKSLDENEEASLTINPSMSSMSSEDMENKQAMANKKDSLPKKKKKKNGAKATEKVRQKPAPKPPKQTSTNATRGPSEENKKDDKPAVLDTKDSKSKQLGKWYMVPLEVDLSNRSQEMERFVEGSRLESLMRRGRPSRLSRLDLGDKYFREELSEYRSVDVVIPCPDETRPSLGSALLNYVCALNADAFAALTTPKQKQLAVDSLISYFESLGSKFLEPSRNQGEDDSNTKTAFRIMSYTMVQGKVSQALGVTTYGILRPEDTPIASYRQVFQFVLEKNLASRRKSIERFLVDTDMKHLMKTYRPSTLKSDKMWGKVFQSVRPIDVLLPHNARSQLGNALLSDVVHRNLDSYANLSSLHDRQIAVDSLVGAFEKLGTRFLEELPNRDDSIPGQGPWRVVSYRVLFEKITKYLRAGSPRQAKGSFSGNDFALDSSVSTKTSGDEDVSSKALKRKELSTTFVSKENLGNVKSVFGSSSVPTCRLQGKKRACSEIESVYQTSFLSKKSKRMVLAPRPVFFEEYKGNRLVGLP